MLSKLEHFQAQILFVQNFFASILILNQKKNKNNLDSIFVFIHSLIQNFLVLNEEIGLYYTRLN